MRDAAARRGRVALALLLPLTATGGAACGDDAPSRCPRQQGLAEAWALSDEGIDVEVLRAPYAITVRDEQGVVLRSSESGAGDGYGAVAWTTGLVSYERFVSPGYTSFFPTLDPWRDGFEVVAAEETGDSLEVVLADTSGADEACITVTHTVRPRALRVEATSDGPTPRAWAAGFETPADEGFLGFGERFNRTDQRGGDVWAWAEEGGIGTGEGDREGPDNPYPHGEMMTYYPVPFFLSTERYGFWLDSSWRNEFNLATERDDVWRVWHVGPTLAYEVYVPTPGDGRPWPYHIIDRFTETTGRPMLPPAWTLGPRRRIGRNDTAPDTTDTVVPEIDAMRDHDLAITAVDDSMHFYPSGSHIGKEAELEAWIDEAEALGYRVNGYYNSFVDRDEDGPLADWAAEGAEAGHYLELESGELPDIWIITGSNTPQLYLVDFTDADATSWYQSSFEWALSLGYSGWMYDFGEYVPWNVVGEDGTTGEELHNLYPVLYARAVHDYMESSELAGDWLAFMRSGYTGASRYVPMVWSGDPAASFEESDGLPSMVPAGVNLGISGAPHWGGDIGGFHCTADGGDAGDEELLTRWIQQGSMSSNMQDQNACVGSSSGPKASIWDAPAAFEAWRVYARLHTRLFPYLYTLAHEATATGAPTMRHPFLEHPDRVELRGVDDAYYFGPALYVAPVLERGAREKSVLLPDELYLSWSSQSLVQGPGEVVLDAPLGELPLLLREGHLIPMLDPAIDTLADEQHPDVVGRADVADVYDVVGLVASGGTAGATLYDGDALAATVDGAPAAPDGFTEAAAEADLATCDGCYLIEPLPADGATLWRVRLSSAAGSVTAGGLTLTADSDRRIRWDLYVVGA